MTKRQPTLESAYLCHLNGVGAARSHRESQEALRCRDDERLAEVADELAAQEVEVLRRCRREYHVHVDVGVRVALIEFVSVVGELVRRVSRACLRLSEWHYLQEALDA
jgi:hypothetical protein